MDWSISFYQDVIPAGLMKGMLNLLAIKSAKTCHIRVISIPSTP
jgi:hypothetical protein